MSQTAALIFAVLLSMPAPLLRAQHEPPAAGHKAAEHRDEEVSPLWKWANFAVLAGALGYLIAKNAGPFFAARSRQIRKGILEAEEARAEAEARMAAVDARLANLQADIEALRREARAEEDSERERLRQEAAAELAKIQAHAEREIAAAGNAARLELKRHAARLALSLAEQKIRARMTAQDEDALLRSFTAGLATRS